MKKLVSIRYTLFSNNKIKTLFRIFPVQTLFESPFARLLSLILYVIKVIFMKTNTLNSDNLIKYAIEMKH